MSDEKQSLSVVVRSDEKGHWVEWNNDGATESLGPYQNEKTSSDVRAAKEREFTENAGHIDDA
ncbi:hypothetical protein ASE04_28770 [Rhizobium sp. Root708]|uniref:hypothetical protein n=1 Tax=Rhizobium sp. Root708 TaxID=1736592 RepID=UPI0006F551D8|nr:hypothetical protein [Rhizobium sp. Root708]KRB57032.1 hypothetical protein ASE04_28770 [Rhizobium sp. Root708]